MVLLYLAIQTVRTVRFIRYPLFRALSFSTQRGILKQIALQTGKGAAVRGAVQTTIGILVDPYNRFAVPLSHGGLITTGEAAGNIVAFDVSDPRISYALALDTFGTLFGIAADVVQMSGQALIDFHTADRQGIPLEAELRLHPESALARAVLDSQRGFPTMLVATVDASIN